MGAFLSYEVEGYCSNNDRPLNCRIEFDGSTVTSFGGVERGRLEPDPDIAGKGVLLAFIVPEIIVLVLGLLIVFSRTDYIWHTERARPTLNAWFVRRTTTWVTHWFSSGSETISSGPVSGYGSDTTGPYQRISDEYDQGLPYPPSGLSHSNQTFPSSYASGYPPSGPSNSNQTFSSSYASEYPPSYAPTGDGQSYRMRPMAPPAQGPRPGYARRRPRPRHRTPTQVWHRFWYTAGIWTHSIVETVFSPFSRDAEWVEKSPERETGEMLYDMFEAILLAVSDSQLLLGAAQVVSFGLLGRCETSQYHYAVGTQLVQLACWSALIAMVLVRRYWKAPLSALIRIGCAVGLAASLVYLYEKQLRFAMTPSYEQRENARDSLIFLPSSCFLDPDLWKQTFEPLSPEQLGALGWENPRTFNFVAHVVLCVCGALALVVLFIRLCRDLAGIEEDRTKRIHNRVYRFFTFLYWTVPYFLGLAFYLYSFVTLFHLRRWVYASGWMDMPDGRNEEEQVHGLGQVAPIVATCAFIIVVCDKWQKLPRIKQDGDDVVD